MSEIQTAHDREREELEALLTSPGWARLRAEVEKRCGPQAYRERARALVRGQTDKDEANLAVLGLELRTEAIEGVIAWPSDRLRVLEAERKKHTETAPPARRSAGVTRPKAPRGRREPTTLD